MINKSEKFDRIDQLFKNVDKVRKEPDFSIEVNNRQSAKIAESITDNEMLRTLAALIAYSQGSKDKLVGRILDSGFLAELFYDFDVDIVARIDADAWLNENWRKTKRIEHNGEIVEAKITYLRFRRKINNIIKVAQVLQTIEKEHGSFIEMLNGFGIPRQLHSQSDIELFWRKFRQLKEYLISLDMPYFKNTTTLLHLLLSLGYDCVKPDSGVQKAAVEIGVVPAAKGDKNLIDLVRTLQEYALARYIRTAVVDFYFLVYGGQSWGVGFVNEPPLKM